MSDVLNITHTVTHYFHFVSRCFVEYSGLVNLNTVTTLGTDNKLSNSESVITVR